MKQYHHRFRRAGLGLAGLLMVIMLLASCGEAASPTTSTTDSSGTPTASPGSGNRSTPTTPKPTPTNSSGTPKPTPTPTKPPAPKPTPTPTPKPKPSVHLVTAQKSITGPATTSVTATCPAGELALSGGWAQSSSDPGRILNSVRQSTNAWTVNFNEATSTTQSVTVYVECLKNASGSAITERNSGNVTVAPGTYGTKYISCNPGEVLVGGGYGLVADVNELTVYNFAASGNAWGGYVWNHSSYDRTMHFSAECLSYTGVTSSFVMSSTHSSGAIATCPSGTYVSGGGFVSNQNSYTYSAKANGNGWQVYINPAVGMNIYAMCLKFS